MTIANHRTIGVDAPLDATPDGCLSHLTPKQIDVLRMAAQGLTNGAIARGRGTGERSVEMLLHSVYAALRIETTGDLNPRVEAIRAYIEAAGLPTRP